MNLYRECYLLQTAHARDTVDRCAAVWRKWHPAGSLRPLWVIVPHPSDIYHWKRVALRHRLSAWNVEWLTPGKTRHRLAEILGRGPLTLRKREETEFIFRQIARRCARDQDPLLLSLAQNAHPLVQAIDQLTSAGHTWDRLPVFQDHPEFKAEVQVWMTHNAPQDRNAVDRELEDQARHKRGSWEGDMILAGFNVEHVSSARLLGAASDLAQRVAVLLETPLPGDESRQWSWHTWWQGRLPSAAETVPGETPETTSPEVPPPLYLIAEHQNHQLACLEKALDQAFLEMKPLDTVGVVVPSDGILAANLAQLLRARGIAFNSEFSEPSTLLPPQRLLQSWFHLQREGLTVSAFTAFLRVIESQDRFWNWLGVSSTAREIEEYLETVYRRTAVPDVEYLARWDAKTVPPALQRWIERWSQLHWPEEALLSEFRQYLEDQLTFLCPNELVAPIREYLRTSLGSWTEFWTVKVRRTDWIDLLGDLLLQAPEPPSDSAWSAVQILSPARARTQAWSHLILAGVNEGVWPGPKTPLPLLPDSLAEALTSQALRPSLQALDEHVFRPGFAPLLTEAAYAQLQRHQFSYLLDSSTGQRWVLAVHWDEWSTNGEAHVSELFRASWSAQTQKDWHKEEALQLRAAANAWAPHSPRRLRPHGGVAAAQRSRRDRTRPFDEYQFFIGQPQPARTLSPTTAELILTNPETAWFQSWLKTRPLTPAWEEHDLFPQVLGSWIHRLLARSFLRATDTPGSEWLRHLPKAEAWKDALREEIRSLQSLFHTVEHRPLLGWGGEWARVHHICLQLLTEVVQLAAQLNWPHVWAASEWDLRHLPATETIQAPLTLPWTGRVDLLLCNQSELEHATHALILDFKTGRGAKEFNMRTTQQTGQHFQLVAYGQLIKPHLDPSVAINVATVTRQGIKWSLEHPLDVTAAEWRPLWKVVAAAWREGCFGQIRSVHAAHLTYENSRLPLATLELEGDILRDKWRHTSELNTWLRFD